MAKWIIRILCIIVVSLILVVTYRMGYSKGLENGINTGISVTEWFAHD